MMSIHSLYNQQIRLIQQQAQPNIPHTKTVADYTSSLRAALRILFTFNDFSGFVEAMQSAIERNLTAAWIAGAEACGISREDLSDAEVSALFGLILRDFSFISGLGAAIISGREQGETITSFFPRLDIWANRWNETFNQAKAMACADRRQVWRLGPTDHCRSCLGLSGKVKRASFWLASGILPQTRVLECTGARCQCFLEDTEAPISPGPLPTTSIGINVGLLAGILLGGIGVGIAAGVATTSVASSILDDSVSGNVEIE